MNLPKTVFGVNTEKAYENYAAGAVKKASKPGAHQGLNVNASINGQDYIRIPNTKILIAKQESYKGMKWEETHFALAENGLFMPTPALFMPYFLSIKDAASGNLTLYDGNNNPIAKEEAEDLGKYLTTNHREGCWTWLDAKFESGNGHLELDVLANHRVVDINGQKTLQGSRLPLEACVSKDCFVDLDFNKQGLARAKASKQSYEQGTNVYFWHPRNGHVAGFGAYSGGAGLFCCRDPAYSYSWLGVFSCAEGTQKNKEQR